MKKYYFETRTPMLKNLFFILDENGKKLSSTHNRKDTEDLQKLVNKTVALMFGKVTEKIGDYYLIKERDHLTADQLDKIAKKVK